MRRNESGCMELLSLSDPSTFGHWPSSGMKRNCLFRVELSFLNCSCSA